MNIRFCGCFNTGTNLLYKIMSKWYDINKVNINVRKGEGHTFGITKHATPKRFLNHGPIKQALKKKNIKFVVIIKDPYFWIKSCFKSPYHEMKNSKTMAQNNLNAFLQMPCHVPDISKETYKSVLDVWNVFYRDAWNLLPHEDTVYVRYEDLLFRPYKTMIDISEKLKLKEFELPDNSRQKLAKIMTPRAKGHGKSRDNRSSKLFYVNLRNKVSDYSKQSLKFFQDNLDKTVMVNYHYLRFTPDNILCLKYSPDWPTNNIEGEYKTPIDWIAGNEYQDPFTEMNEYDDYNDILIFPKMMDWDNELLPILSKMEAYDFLKFRWIYLTVPEKVVKNMNNMVLFEPLRMFYKIYNITKLEDGKFMVSATRNFNFSH